ncbi:outer membrane protein [Roseibium sp.]|uniref:outer membrane protein n=1 Tax=Roseibium sp. TaxID=1936156 RepID=UPI003A9878E0
MNSFFNKMLPVAAVVAGATILSGTASAQDGGIFSDLYVRGEAGAAFLAEDRGNWTPPGVSDPRITHSLDDETAFFGSIGFGAQVVPGIRTDLSLGYQSQMSVHGDPRSASDGSDPSTHADMDADVSSWQIMANVFIEPFALMNYDSPISPFVTGGIGVAFNKMDDWTRTSNEVAPTRLTRTFEGDTSTEFAWSIGGGVSADLDKLFGFERPVKLDLTYRYLNAGNVSGGSTPLPGEGAGVPREPFNFDLTSHVATIGVRIPFSMN